MNDELPFNVEDLVPPEPPAPPLNLLVVECAVCHEQLVNLLTRWIHEPGTEHDHLPKPQPRTDKWARD